MHLRNLLLTSGYATILALAPLSVAQAQNIADPGLLQAYAAYQSDSSDANKQALTDACTAAGFADLESCLAALKAAEEAGGAQGNAQDQTAAPASSDDAAPPAADASSAAPAAQDDQTAAPAEDDTSSSAPAADEQTAAPAADDASSAAPAEQSDETAAPVDEQASSAAPADEQTDETSAPADDQSSAAPAAEDQTAAPAADEASSSAAPEASSEPAATGPSVDADALATLQAAVADYNQGVEALKAGDSSGTNQINEAKATIDATCSDLGFDSTDACLAAAGLTLQPVPETSTPAASSEQPAATSSSSEQPVSSEEATSSEAPAPSSEMASSSEAPTEASSSEMPSEVTSEQPSAAEEPSSMEPVSEMQDASEEVSPSAVEPLPADVSDEPAPLLDSEKDKGPASGQPSSEQPASEQPSAEPAAPPPDSDQAAQADIKAPPSSDDQFGLTEEGKQSDIKFVQPEAPKDNGDVKVVQKPKNDTGAFVFQIGINLFIKNNEQERNRYYDARQDKIQYEDLNHGRTRETITRPDGAKIVTVYNRNGDVLTRVKVTPDGHRVYLATYDQQDNGDLDNWRDPGQDLPPLHLNIPADQYILDASSADTQSVESFLEQPPVEKVRRIYSIDEVKRSARIRDMVRRLEVRDLTFDTGKATISRDQVDVLNDVAQAMLALLQRDPGEVFLIEGHTDLVGSAESNLVLSDERAATVARVLTDFYDIPPENLVTQGYGEAYPRVLTEGPSAINRRVTIKRITPLISYEANAKG